MSHYFECHVTVKPFEAYLENFGRLVELGKSFGFSVRDNYLTATSNDGEELRIRMRKLIRALQDGKYSVMRYKLKAAVLDSKFTDTERLLDAQGD